jgi:hypothetical protein
MSISEVSNTTFTSTTRVIPQNLQSNLSVEDFGWFVELVKQHVMVFPDAFNPVTKAMKFTVSKTPTPMEGVTGSSSKYYIRNNQER